MKMTKFLAALAALTMTCTMLPMHTMPETVITADAAEYGQLTYTVQVDGTIAITGCAEDAVSVEIPEEIEGKKVTSIVSGAFSGCTSLASVTIPDSVTSIGKYAFYYCTSLTSVTIPDGVTSIEEGTFAACHALKKLTIPDTVEDIYLDTGLWGDAPIWSAFGGCESLTELVISDYNTKYLFQNGLLIDRENKQVVWCTHEKTSVVIPESIQSIGSCAFYGCSNLTDITIPDSVTSIGGQAFNDCTSLASVTIPDSVTSIEWAAFCDCTSLTSITIPDSVTSIGRHAFYRCTSLASITIPDSVTSIGVSAFNGTAWYNAQPDGVVYIENWAYDYKGEMPEETAITLRDGTVGIVDSAFSYCKNLASVTIPDSVKSIGQYALTGCTSLTDITILNPDCEIYDHAGTITNYYSEMYNEKIYTGTITGYEGSTAQAYAEKYGRTFVSLGEAPAPAPVYGDVNESGKVDIADVIDLCRASMGGYTLTEQGFQNADVNGDGNADTTDASYILQSLIGLAELPVR